MNYLLPTDDPVTPDMPPNPPKLPNAPALNLPEGAAPNVLPEGVSVVDPKVPGPVVGGVDGPDIPAVKAFVCPLGPTTIDVVAGGPTGKGFPGLVTMV